MPATDGMGPQWGVESGTSATSRAGSSMNPGRNYTRFLFWVVGETSLFRKDDFLRGTMDVLGLVCDGLPEKICSILTSGQRFLFFHVKQIN
jgi:hypothetical protein